MPFSKSHRVAAASLNYLKAGAAFVTPGAALLYMATFSDSLGGEAVTQTEFVRAALVCLLTAGGVAAVPNVKRRSTP